MLPGLDRYSTCTDPAKYVISAAIGSTVDYLYDLHDLDRFLSEMGFIILLLRIIIFFFSDPIPGPGHDR